MNESKLFSNKLHNFTRLGKKQITLRKITTFTSAQKLAMLEFGFILIKENKEYYKIAKL